MGGDLNKVYHPHIVKLMITVWTKCLPGLLPHGRIVFPVVYETDLTLTVESAVTPS